MKSLLSILLVGCATILFNCAPSVRSSVNQNDMEGWHFHICSNETEASRIWFELSGMGDNSTYKSHEVKWQRGRDLFVLVPSEVRNLESINLSVRTSGKRKAKVCVLYGEYVVKSIEVTGTENNKLSRDDNRDNCPC